MGARVSELPIHVMTSDMEVQPKRARIHLDSAHELVDDSFSDLASKRVVCHRAQAREKRRVRFKR